MVKKLLSLILVILMMSPMFTMTNMTSSTFLQDTPQDSISVAETDLGRVTWEANTAPNPGFENWYSPSYPADYSTSRTLEKHTWYETTIVSEGARSLAMETRNLDPDGQTPEIRLTQQSWIYWNNPINTTVELDWYIDEIANSTNEDYFRMQVQMSSRRLYYYFGCTTEQSNSTSYAYIHINGPIQTWNHFARNVTSDFIEAFSVIPTRFELIYWWVRSDNSEYTRVYLDDVKLYNGSYSHVGGSTLNGNFEATGNWVFDSNNDPAFVVQSPIADAGEWSMNMTVISNDYTSRCTASYQPRKRLSEINKGQLSFYWQVEDYNNTGWNSVAEIDVSVSNTITSLTMHYYLFIGGSGNYPIIMSGEDMQFKPSGFNVTGTWNFFNRSIWDDFDIYGSTDELWVETISIRVGSSEDNSRLSVLIDNLSLETSLLNDMSYETQGAIGTPVEGWTEPTSPDVFTVTDFAATGTRAGNMTLCDDEYFSYSQSFGDLYVNESTELILDFNVYIETFNHTSDDHFFFELFFEDYSVAYVIANASTEVEDYMDGSEKYCVILQEDIMIGQWMNFEIDLIHTYEELVGSFPEGILDSIRMNAYAQADSCFNFFLDDLYLYGDIAPEIVSVDQTPSLVEEAGTPVEITAEIMDGSAVTVTLSYRTNSSAWINVTMEEIASGIHTYEFNAPLGETEYFIEAEDAFGKKDTAMDGGDYFNFITADTMGPVISLLPINGSTVSDIASIEWNVTDYGIGVAWSQLFIEGLEITNTTIETVGISWDTTILDDGDYNITVVACDILGHTTSVTHFITVDNVVETTTTTSSTPSTNTTTTTSNGPPANLIDPVLLVVVVAIVGVVIVLYIFVMKKK